MPEIDYKDLDDRLKSGISKDQVFLVHGDSFLCEEAVKKIISSIFKSGEPGMNFEKADGLSAQSVGNAIEFLMTRSFIPGPKAVCITDARIFDSKADNKSLLSKARQAFEKDDQTKASKIIVKYLSESGEEISSLTSLNYIEKLGLTQEDDWVWRAIVHAREIGISQSDGTGESAIIERAIDRGLPVNHHLIMVSDSVDRKKTSYKSFLPKALVINCHIPKGDRKADRDVQDEVFRQRAVSVLGPLGKSLDAQAFAALKDITGDDLRVFSANLGLLADFTAERQKITKDDIARVLVRTKQDPIYEFTNALGSKNMESSLFLMRSLIDSGAHPLQIMASMINLVRRLLVIKSFCESEKGRGWRSGMSYPDFQAKLMPVVTNADTELSDIIASWTSSSSSKGSKKATKTDLLIAKGASPYPVYLLFQKASGFRLENLLKYFEELSGLDLRMKTSSADSILLIENFIIKFCTSAIKQ